MGTTRKRVLQNSLYRMTAIVALTGLAMIYSVRSGSRELGAYYLAHNKFGDSNYACLENFDGKTMEIDGYHVEVLEERGMFRTVTFSWNTFLIPHSLTLTFLTSPGCILD